MVLEFFLQIVMILSEYFIKYGVIYWRHINSLDWLPYSYKLHVDHWLDTLFPVGVQNDRTDDQV